jgi:S1-C subfamily serine protease
MKRQHVHLLVVALAAALALVAGRGAASAAPAAPEPALSADQAIALASPGVVLVENKLAISIRLKVEDARSATGFAAFTGQYRQEFVGTGFVVNPTGTIVTASHVVQGMTLQEARTYAANELIFGPQGLNMIGRLSDPRAQVQLRDSWWNTVLQQCYDGTVCTVTIARQTSVYTPVAIAGQELPKPMTARVLRSTGFDSTDVAILQVDGQNMPTVALARSAANVQPGTPITALGFAGSGLSLPTGLTEPTKRFGRVSNVRPMGSSEQIEVDAKIEPGMSGGPVIDDRGRVIGLVSYGMLQDDGSRGSEYLRSVDDIRAALAEAGQHANRGRADTTFSQAMSYFWASHFSAAVPLFQQVIALSAGHPLATQYLSQAQAKAGGASDVPLSSGGFPLALAGAIGGGALLLVAGGALALRRRSPRPAAAPAPPADASLGTA